MLLLTLGCFQIVDPFHSEEFRTGERYAAENSHYLWLEPDKSLLSLVPPKWVGEMSKSDYAWGVS